jgi:predicted nucleic acid-binding protein
MLAVDTSVVVAAFAGWHDGHLAAVGVLARRPRLPVHVLLESYSVLTRFPPPHRTSPAPATSFLETRFPEPPLGLPPAECRRLVADAATNGVAGGAIYDALIAWTAKRAGATLLTRDRRAVRVYEAVGVRFELVA